MFEPTIDPLSDIHAYCERENVTGSLANISALLMAAMTDVNWLGFYLYDGEVLRLGPFQGKPACTTIALGKGVCGSAATEKRTLLVEDVEKFPGHIACDSASRSELVVPIYLGQKLFGVLDVDSPILARFGDKEQKFFEAVVEILKKELL